MWRGSRNLRPWQLDKWLVSTRACFISAMPRLMPCYVRTPLVGAYQHHVQRRMSFEPLSGSDFEGITLPCQKRQVAFQMTWEVGSWLPASSSQQLFGAKCMDISQFSISAALPLKHAHAAHEECPGRGRRLWAQHVPAAFAEGWAGSLSGCILAS